MNFIKLINSKGFASVDCWIGYFLFFKLLFKEQGYDILVDRRLIYPVKCEILVINFMP